MAARGDDWLTIVARAGHQDMEMTRHYVQQAALLRRTFNRQAVFPPLPACLLGDDDDPAEPPSPAGSRAISVKKHREMAEAHENRTHQPPREGRAHPF